MKTKHAHTNGWTVKHTDKDYCFVRSDPFQHTRKCSMALKLNCKNIENMIFCLNRSKSIVISLVRGIIIFYLTSLRFLRWNLTKKKNLDPSEYCEMYSVWENVCIEFFKWVTFTFNVQTMCHACKKKVKKNKLLLFYFAAINLKCTNFIVLSLFMKS